MFNNIKILHYTTIIIYSRYNFERPQIRIILLLMQVMLMILVFNAWSPAVKLKYNIIIIANPLKILFVMNLLLRVEFFIIYIKSAL